MNIFENARNTPEKFISHCIDAGFYVTRGRGSHALARFLGVTPRAVQYWLAGKRKIPISVIELLLKNKKKRK